MNESGLWKFALEWKIDQRDIETDVCFRVSRWQSKSVQQSPGLTPAGTYPPFIIAPSSGTSLGNIAGIGG
jgi:hypothetical protein